MVVRVVSWDALDTVLLSVTLLFKNVINFNIFSKVFYLFIYLYIKIYVEL
jgi:hypothetical protein